MTRDETIADCLTRKWRVKVYCSPGEFIVEIAIESGLQIGYAKSTISEIAAVNNAYWRALDNYKKLTDTREKRLVCQPELWGTDEAREESSSERNQSVQA